MTGAGLIGTTLTALVAGAGELALLTGTALLGLGTTVLALHKIGAIVVPATFLLTTNDIVYRCKSAEITAIVCCGDKPILEKVAAAEPKCPYLEHMISIGPEVPEGFEDFEAGVAAATPWERGSFLNESEDPFLMYFTSGTSDEPKMVLHAHTYAISHLVTAAFWHNLKEDSLHLTYSDTGWGKAAWGKLYGQWIVGCAIFYGYGLACYRLLGVTYAVMVGAAMVVGQYCFARYWFNTHSRGPLEGLWRKLTWMELTGVSGS